MKKALYDQFLDEYVRAALHHGDQDVDAAASYLMGQRTPRFLVKQEKKLALERAQKVFSAYSDRPLWFVLKCLGLEADQFQNKE